MKTFLRKKTAILLMALFSSAFVFQSCEKILDDIISILETGWLMDDEDMDNIPEDITPFEDEDDPVVVETKISLEHLFPPIGDQGQYGTCVAWSVGYNLKTALNAIEKGWKT